MSFKRNQANPDRRATLLARRNSAHPGTNIETLPKDKYGVPTLRLRSPYAQGGYGPSLMKKSRRNACMRRLAKRVKAKEIAVPHAEFLAKFVLAGTVSREMVYGYHPTR